ncbi:MAG: winged helix-turn-helix domain-containing protein [Desulfurococcaceae archaeon]
MSLDKKHSVEYYGRKVFVGSHGPVTGVTSVLETRARRAIVHLLATRGPLTLKELSAALDLAPSTVHDHLRKLKEAGVVVEATEHPKRFRVEVYYRLNLPFILASELNRLREDMGELINKFSEFFETMRVITAERVKAADLKCLKYKDPSMYERIVFVLLSQLFLLMFHRYLNEPLTYILINDLEESEPDASSSS